VIGQSFSDPQYFWSRPSATAPQPYNALASTGSNQGPLTPALTDAVKARVEALKAADPTNTLPVPVTWSPLRQAVGPDISIAAANYQAARVARARGIEPAEVQPLIGAHAKQVVWPAGEPRINVLS